MTSLFRGRSARGGAWIALVFQYTLLPVVIRAQGTHEVCQWQSFNAQCPDDHVIVMTRAVYGRMRLGRCVKEDLGFLGCQIDVKRIVDAKCSGRKQCSVAIPDQDLDKEKPCSELQNYLEASYECRKVQALDDRGCRKCDYVRVQNEVGYLASAVTLESGCGSMDCPWFISGGQGQSIRISLLDFSLAAAGSEHFSEMCKVYAVIKEKNAQKSKTICGGKGANREREVYVSEGPELEIRIMGKTQDQTNDHFLVKYEVVGCKTLTVEGAAISYGGNEAHISCNSIDRGWTMTCNGTHWQGPAANCSYIEPLDRPDEHSADPVFNTTSLVIMATVALIICTLVVIIGIVCFKICTHNPRPRRTPHSYEDPPDLCHPPPLTHDTYCVTHIPTPHPPEGAMTLDRCVASKVTCKTYAFENGQKNEYEHICDSTIPRIDFNT